MNEGGGRGGGGDHLAGMCDILRAIPFLSGRARLLHRVRVAGSLSAALPGLWAVVCDLLKRLGS